MPKSFINATVEISLSCAAQLNHCLCIRVSSNINETMARRPNLAHHLFSYGL